MRRLNLDMFRSTCTYACYFLVVFYLYCLLSLSERITISIVVVQIYLLGIVLYGVVVLISLHICVCFAFVSVFKLS